MSEASSYHSPLSPADSASDDVLAEVLLHLPPHPAFPSRASLVCKRWRAIVHDQSFLRRFRAFHGTPPVLCLFCNSFPWFVTIEDPPGHIDAVARRFSKEDNDMWLFLDCRDGHALLHSRHWTDPLVWDPMTNERHRIIIPLQVFACVYSSQTGLWGEVISMKQPSPCMICLRPGVLICDALYWPADCNSGILMLELGRQRLALVQRPPEAKIWNLDIRVMKSQDGGLGVAFVEDFILQLWALETDHDDTVKWVLCRTIELFTLLQLPYYETPGKDGSIETYRTPVRINGISEDGKVVVVTNSVGILLWPDTLRFKHVSRQGMRENNFYPYGSFYVPEGLLKLSLSSPAQPGASARKISPSLSGTVSRSLTSMLTATLAALSPWSSAQTHRTPIVTSLTRHRLPQRSASLTCGTGIISSMTQNPLSTLRPALGSICEWWRGGLAKWRGWCDAARVVLYLLSDEAKHVNGHSLIVALKSWRTNTLFPKFNTYGALICTRTIKHSKQLSIQNFKNGSSR